MFYELPATIREFLLYIPVTVIKKSHTTTIIITIIFETKGPIYLHYKELKKN